MIAFGMASSQIRLCFTSLETAQSYNWERKLSKERAKKPSQRVIEGEELKSENSSEDEKDAVEVINFLSGHSGPVHAVSFHPKTKLLFSGSQDGTVRAWDINTFKCRTVYK
jgi:WD40 repeat protein